MVLDRDKAPRLLGRGDARPELFEKRLDRRGEVAALQAAVARGHAHEHRRLGPQPLGDRELARQVERSHHVAGNATERHVGRGERLPHVLHTDRVDLLPLAAMRLRPEVDQRRAGFPNLRQDLLERKCAVDRRCEDPPRLPGLCGPAGAGRACDRRGGGLAEETSSRGERHAGAASRCGRLTVLPSFRKGTARCIGSPRPSGPTVPGLQMGSGEYCVT